MPPFSADSKLGCRRLPWRVGNRFRLLADGEAFYPAMLEAIEGSRRYLLLEMYLMEPGKVAERFIDALCAAARRGVAVYVMLDGFGSRALGEAERGRLTGAGVHLAVHNPLRYGSIRRNLFRDHRKLLLADGEVAFVGGAGISDEWEGERPWRDTMVELRGECVEQWRRLFFRNWRYWSRLRPPPLDEIQAAEGEGMLGRVSTARGGLRSEMMRCLIQRVRHAERRVWLATGYFMPSWKLRRALRRAARRGVDVRLLLPGPITDHPAVRHAGRRFYARLLHHGVRIFEYQPRFHHQKVALCDHWVSVGSANIDRWTLRWNLEANQEVEEIAFANEVRELLERDFAESLEIACDDWAHRSRWGRAMEWFWGAVDRWVDRTHPPGRGGGEEP